MSNNNFSNTEFVICVQEFDLRHKMHVLIHPVLLVSNDNQNSPVSPESVIEGFRMLGTFQKSKLISISKNQVTGIF